jgi:hypothetical protein
VRGAVGETALDEAAVAVVDERGGVAVGTELRGAVAGGVVAVRPDRPDRSRLGDETVGTVVAAFPKASMVAPWRPIASTSGRGYRISLDSTSQCAFCEVTDIRWPITTHELRNDFLGFGLPYVPEAMQGRKLTEPLVYGKATLKFVQNGVLRCPDVFMQPPRMTENVPRHVHSLIRIVFIGTEAPHEEVANAVNCRVDCGHSAPLCSIISDSRFILLNNLRSDIVIA